MKLGVLALILIVCMIGLGFMQMAKEGLRENEREQISPADNQKLS